MLRVFKQYYPIRNILFVLGEFLVVFNSVLFATWILLDSKVFSANPWLYFKAFLITIVCQICLYYNDLYDFRVTNSYSELTIRLLQSLGAASIILACIYFVFSEAIIGKGIFAVSISFGILFIVSWRYCYTIILNKGIFDKKIMILGNSGLAKDIADEIYEKKDSGYTVTFVVTDAISDVDMPNVKATTIKCKKNYADLCEIVKRHDISKIIVALKQRRGAFPVAELLKCRVNGIDIMEGNTFYEMLTGKLIVKEINPAWLIFSGGFKKSLVRRILKRIEDIVLSLILLVFFLPIILFTAILIKIDSKGPIIFSQDRVGMNKKEYKVHKFRSMVTDAEKQTGPVWAKDNDERVTRVGKFIRKCRIDEFPQLWNILKGEMSFVGPRPERNHFVEQLEKIIPYYRERFTVKPGLTGWAQVSYGYGATIEDAVEKLNYDLFYIKNMSILMDFMIILRTIKTVLFGKGVH